MKECYNKLMEKSLQGGNDLTARELTEAIEAATDLTVDSNREAPNGLEISGSGTGNTGARDAVVERSLGRAAQFAGGDFTTGAGAVSESQIIASNNEIKQIVAAENGYAESGDLTPGENVVGGESAIEVKERLESDRETAKIQSGEGLSKDQLWMHEIAVKSGQKMAEAVEREVEEITKVPDFNPNTLEKARFKWMLDSLRGDEGHTFGAHN